MHLTRLLVRDEELVLPVFRAHRTRGTAHESEPTPVFELPRRVGEAASLPPADWHRLLATHAPCDAAGRPAVLRGSAWQMVPPQLWSDANLSSRYPDVRLSAVELSTKERRRTEPRRRVPLREFLLWVQQNESVYAVSKLPRQMRGDVQLPQLLTCGGALERLSEAVLWLSPGGTKSVIHADPHDGLLCALDGSKRLALWHPRHQPEIETRRSGWEEGDSFASKVDVDAVDLTRFPAWGRLPWEEATIESGDCLFLPTGWYHFVQSSAGRNLALTVAWERPCGDGDGDGERPPAPPPDPTCSAPAGQGHRLSECYVASDYRDEWTADYTHVPRVGARGCGVRSLARFDVIVASASLVSVAVSASLLSVAGLVHYWRRCGKRKVA